MILLFIFADFFLSILNTPEEIFSLSKTYLLIISGFFLLNCYIRVLSFFIKSDGQAKLTFRAILIANILNITLDFILYKLFDPSISSIAFALVIGYLIGAIYISRYFLKKDSTFKLVSLSKISFKDFIEFTISLLHSTPEVIGRICFTVKTLVIFELCATFLGGAGLLAYLVYDNVETVIYLFIAGIINTADPIITLFYNEKDYPIIKFIMKKAIIHILITTLIICLIFIIYPEILLELFSITSINEQHVVTIAIIITSIGLISRTLCLMLVKYAQSICQFSISAILNFVQEFIGPLIFLPVFITLYGGIGIWIAITLSEITATCLYPLLILWAKRKHKIDFENNLLMIPDSESIHWTCIRGNFEEIDNSMQSSNKKIIKNIESIFDTDYLIITKTLEKIAKNIFNKEKTINKIDISVIINNDGNLIRFIYDGNPVNPIENEKLLDSEYLKFLERFKYSFDYYRIFELNLIYIKLSEKSLDN